MSVGDPRFHALLRQIGELHDKKQEDYGAEKDPFANVRASQEWGVPPWVGALVRLNDKVHRLKRFAQRGSLANESAEDSMMDIAVYALIALVLYREHSQPSSDRCIGCGGALGGVYYGAGDGTGQCFKCPRCYEERRSA